MELLPNPEFGAAPPPPASLDFWQPYAGVWQPDLLLSEPCQNALVFPLVALFSWSGPKQKCQRLSEWPQWEGGAADTIGVLVTEIMVLRRKKLQLGDPMRDHDLNTNHLPLLPSLFLSLPSLSLTPIRFFWSYVSNNILNMTYDWLFYDIHLNHFISLALSAWFKILTLWGLK